MGSFDVFDPTTDAKEQPLDFASRPNQLRGLRVGLIDNTKYNSAKLLLKIAEIIEQEHGTTSHRVESKPNASVSVDQASVDTLKKQCDVVIAGIGD